MRAYGGRVARLQAIYADPARSENREEELEEKEISARLGDWLRTGGKLKETMADLLAQQLREDWASERIGENARHDPGGPGGRGGRRDPRGEWLGYRRGDTEQ